MQTGIRKLKDSLKWEWKLTTGKRILLILALMQTVSALLLIVMTITVLIHLGDLSKAKRFTIQQETNQRIEAARDSCVLLIGLVNAATPPSQRKAAQAYKDRTPLKNCNVYARDLVTPKSNKPVIPGHPR